MVLYNIQGQKVGDIMDRNLPAGEHVVRYNASGLPDGIYLVRVQAGGESVTEKVVVMR